MDKTQLEFLIQKRMEQCVRDDYLIKNHLVAILASPLHERSSNTDTGIANVQQLGKASYAAYAAKPIQNQADNSNSVNLTFTEKYINNIYDLFYQLIHHEKYRYMDDYISNFSNNIEQATLNINSSS